MGKRREGREAAIQYLFQRDLNSAEKGTQSFWELRPASEGVRTFGQTLIHGVVANQDEIDLRIKGCTQNYELNRIAAVDRNILRVAVYEMLFCKETPPVVAINEAIEIAKRFGSEESSRFVNGVLDKIRHQLQRPARQAEVSD